MQEEKLSVTAEPVTSVTWDSRTLTLVRDWTNEGKSSYWMADKLGISWDAFRKGLSRHGLKLTELRPNQSGASKLERNARAASIAERLAILQGLTPAPEVEKKFSFSDEQLKAWVGNPELFFKELLSIELYDYQKQMLALLQRHRRTVFCCGRGIGKTYITSLWLLYRAIITPSQKCLVIAPSDRQARILLEYVHTFIANSDALFRSVDFKKTNLERITFTNTSWVAPLGSTSFLRGFQNIDLLILDEASYLQNADAIWASVIPMLKSETGQFVVASTPNVVGDKFHQAFLNPSFVHLQIPATQSPRFTPADLELMQQDLTPHEYATEVLAEFVEGSDNFFSPELIQRCTQKYDFSQFPEENNNIYGGVDWGRFRDASVILFIQKQPEDVLKVIFAKELNNTPLPQQVHIVKQLTERWFVKELCAESNGLSIHAVEELKGLGVPVQAFQPTIETKQEAFTHLLRLMEQGKIILPMIPRLQFQLRNFRYEVTNTGKLKLHHSTELVGDDWCDALAFAVWASRKQSGGFFVYGVKGK